ncbi:hypothetical protein [Laspinema olomoucense]|uniref:Uncharacterized protein n=1 Tax=Laspinema olomoucense D3b TaxID=2953688 RepID=A0ABT2N7Z0_9CYAN|nr:hypothetical protein [Laspinema sp. D3b]MCT7978798.1 hypothetical protein [Laspinema sp. D3b]
MQIIQRTSTQLKLKILPLLIWMIGGIIMSIGVRQSQQIGRYRVICDRLPDSGHCEISQSSFWQTYRQTFPLKDLQGAEVVLHNSRNPNTAYKVVLLLPGKLIPLHDFLSSDRPAHQKQADLINQFVQDSTQSKLAISRNMLGLMITPFLLVCGTGLLTIACFGQIIILKLDKPSNQFILTWRGILGTKRIEHPLRNIARSYVEPSISRRIGRQTYVIKVMLTSGETFAVTPYKSSGYEEKLRTTQEIHSFLGIEPTETT